MTGRLLIMHDSAEFGGHERMLLNWLPAVLDAADTAPTFCVPAANSRLREALTPFAPRLRIVASRFTKQRGEPYLHSFRLAYRAAVRRLVADEQPDTVLLVQGRIENLVVPMVVLPRSVRVVSYLPMAHRLVEMGRRAPFGDAIRRRLYARPDAFIVPSAAVAAQVVAAGAAAPVTVVGNVAAAVPRVEPEVARAMLRLPTERRIALFLGRLDNGQKGLDALARAMARSTPAALAGWTFVFAGDGPGAAALAVLRDRGVADIIMAGWTERPDLFVAAADVLLLPSRWEGLPLAMLEAMQAGLPILASPLDVFRDALPSVNIVDFATVDLGIALDVVLASGAAFRHHAGLYLKPFTLEAGRQQFALALAAVR